MTIITYAFTQAARYRAQALGLPEHSVVVVEHPLASKTREQAQHLAHHSVEAVVRPNATIGRALRLTMRNLGGATADTMEKSTHGWPGKYTMCFAEHAARNPWEPLHMELGFAPGVSIVVVVAARGLITIVESSQESGLSDLETLVSAMRGEGISGYYYRARGASPVVVVGPEHAAEITAAGLGRKEIKAYIFHHARISLGQLRDGGHWGARSWPEAWEDQPEDFLVPIVTSPDQLILVVAGGDGRHSSWFPAWSATQRAIEVSDEPSPGGRG